jgi:hypothetical protein
VAGAPNAPFQFLVSNVPVVSCVVLAMLFDDVSLVKSQGPFPNPPTLPRHSQNDEEAKGFNA